jgi:hypothetical protein
MGAARPAAHAPRMPTDPTDPSDPGTPATPDRPRYVSRAHLARPDRAGGWLVNGVGIAVFGVATIGAVGAASLASFGTSYCGEGPSTQDLHNLQASVAVIGLLWAAVPATFGLVSRLQRRASATAWFCLAGVCALLGLAAAASVTPSSWCF